MVNGKMPLYLTLAALALSVAALLILQPYSADFPHVCICRACCLGPGCLAQSPGPIDDMGDSYPDLAR
jgi:hypothetical protein